MNYKDADTCEGNSCPAWEPLTYWASEESVVRVNFIIVQTAGKKVLFWFWVVWRLPAGALKEICLETIKESKSDIISSNSQIPPFKRNTM